MSFAALVLLLGLLAVIAMVLGSGVPSAGQRAADRERHPRTRSIRITPSPA